MRMSQVLGHLPTLLLFMPSFGCQSEAKPESANARLLRSLGYESSSPDLYTIELRLALKRPMDSASTGGPDSSLVLGVRNPDVYLVFRAKGSEKVRLIPELVKRADGRTAVVSFLLPHRLEQREFVIELWEDWSVANDFWKNLASALQLPIAGRRKADVTPVVQGGGNIGVTIDGKHLARSTRKKDELLGQCEGMVPIAGRSQEFRVMKPANVGNTVGVGASLPIGTLNLTNHGEAQVR